MGRRVARTEGANTTIYAQSGQQTLCDYAAGAAPSASTYRYLFASYIDEPVVRITMSGSVATYLHRNQQYSITALTNSTGAVIERYAYTAYGVPTNASGTVLTSSAQNNRYLYTGREWDGAISLYHYRARMYDASLGRFCSKDPIGYRDGSNLYRAYFSLKSTDPFGLYVEAPTVHDCWDRWGVKCQRDCDEIYGADWFPNYSEWGKCKAGCRSHLVACGEEFVPTVVRLECDSPECNKYDDDDDYARTDAKCFCKCAGNSDWSQYVRGCLRQMDDADVDPHESHMICYARADAEGFDGGRPLLTLLNCVRECYGK